MAKIKSACLLSLISIILLHGESMGQSLSTATNSPSAKPTIRDNSDDECFHFVRNEFISLSNLKKIRDHIKEITWNTSNGVFDFDKNEQRLSGEENIKLIKRKYGIGVQLMRQLADLFSTSAEIKPIKVNTRVSNRYLIFSLNRDQFDPGVNWKYYLFFEKIGRPPNDHKLKFIGYFHGLHGEHDNVGAFPELVQIRDKTWLAMDSWISSRTGGIGEVKASVWIYLSDHIGNKLVLQYISMEELYTPSIDFIPYTETTKIANTRFENGNYIVKLSCRVQFKPDDYYKAIGLRDLVFKGTIRYILNKRSGCFEFDQRHSNARLSPFYRQCCDKLSYVVLVNTLTSNCDNKSKGGLHQPKDILLRAFYHRLVSTARRANYEQLALFESLLRDCQPSKEKDQLKKIVKARTAILGARLNK